MLDILRTTEEFFREREIPAARLDAELILADVLNCQRIHLYANYARPLDRDEVDEYRELVRQRGQFVPVHYLVGKREFFSLKFRVNRHVLIPRPETEFVVQRALDLVKESGKPQVRVSDIGTGCGAIAITIAFEFANVDVHASDISPEALAVARENSEALGVSDRVTFYEGDLFAAFGGSSNEKFDFILSNPPYVRTDEFADLRPEVAEHEPRVALDGGPDGLQFYRRLVSEAPDYLNDGGYLILEIGAGQAESVFNLIRQIGRFLPPEVADDYAGIPRVVQAKLND